MRITGGKACGIVLKTVDVKALRPATDALRQALFSSLGDRIVECSFLDLFAGTGAYGLEALSRGASGGYFVENNKQVVNILRKNIESVVKSLAKTDECVHVFFEDALAFRKPLKVDCIFLDPPYALLDKDTFSGLWLKICEWLNPGGFVCVEIPSGQVLPKIEKMHCVKQLGKSGKGKPTIAIYAIEE